MDQHSLDLPHLSEILDYTTKWLPERRASALGWSEISV
jgi:hypothetical protein